MNEKINIIYFDQEHGWVEDTLQIQASELSDTSVIQNSIDSSGQTESSSIG